MMSKYIEAEWLIARIPSEEMIARMAVAQAPTIDIPTWIPCEERLPERQGYYICTCKDGTKDRRTTPVKWSNGWQLSGARAYWIVLAWMPLPQPYKENGAEVRFEIVTNGNCSCCGKPLSGNRLFLCEECSEKNQQFIKSEEGGASDD